MRQKVYLLFILIVQISCQSNSFDEENVTNVSDTFSFVGIEYIYDNRTIIREYSIELYPIVIENNTGVVQYFDNIPAKRMVESVRFYSSHPLAFSFEDGERFIKIPTNVFSNNTLLYDDGKQWIYSEDNQEREFDSSSFCRTIKIKPANKLIVISRYQYRDVSTYYKLYLKGIEKGEELIIDGYFTWTTFLNYEADYVLD